MGSSQNKVTKAQSCQNSTEKIYKNNKIGLKTLYTGCATQRSHNSTGIKRTKKELDKPEFEFINTEVRTKR